MERVPMTVIETEEFVLAAERLLIEVKRVELVTFVATKPEARDIIPETGGVRKLRWGAGGSREAGWRPSDLLLPQRAAASRNAGYVREERKGQLDEGRAKRNDE